jgi:hypothetical protein
MANILKSKYGDGHKVLIKDRTGLSKVRNDIPSLVSKASYGITPGKTVFELLKTKSKQKNPKHTITLSKDAKGEQVFMKKFNSTITYLFVGPKSVIQGMFDHAGDGKSSKSDTNDKTELKELVSLCVMEQKLKFNKDVDYDFVDTCIPTRLKKMFTEEYLDSAKKQLKLWLSKESGRFKGNNYAFERQLDNYTKDVYKNALDLAKLQKDNWNPGDIWIVNKRMNFEKYKTASNIQQINKQLVEDYKKENLVGISLKAILKNQTGRIDYINLSPSKSKEVAFDFTFTNCDFTGDTFKNAIIYSKSGFGVRMGFKASTDNFGVYLEGRFKGAGSQVGGMDAKQIPGEIQKRYGYTIRKGGTPDLKTEEPLALEEMKKIFKRHPANKISNTLTSYNNFMDIYNKAPLFQKQRFCRIVSFMYPYMELSFKKGGEKEFKDLMNWSYSLAKKESGIGGFYVFLGP